MKRIFVLLVCSIMCLGITVNVYAGELNKNEQSIIEQITGDKFEVKPEQRYVNQLKNYFCQDDVNLEGIDADNFVMYLKEAFEEKQSIDDRGGSFDEKSSAYQNFQKAGSSIELLLEYDSSVNGFYAIDKFGYIVIDGQDVIKNTGKQKEKELYWP